MTSCLRPASTLPTTRHREGTALARALLGADVDTARTAEDQAVVLACSAGAIEVGYPTALHVGKTMTFFDPHHLVPCGAMPAPRTRAFALWTASVPAPRYAPLAGARSVVVVDDGLLDPEALVAMAAALRNGGVSSILVAAPWLQPSARRALAAIADGVVMSIGGSDAPEYDEAPDLDRACRYLARVITSRRVPPSPDLRRMSGQNATR